MQHQTLLHSRYTCLSRSCCAGNTHTKAHAVWLCRQKSLCLNAAHGAKPQTVLRILPSWLFPLFMSPVTISLPCLSAAAGSGVNVYMIDTGIKFTHQEFGHMDGTPGSRAVPGFSVFGDNNSSDCYGHGTHTAATVGGKNLDSAQSRSRHVVTSHVVNAATQSLCTVWKLLYSHTVHGGSCCICHKVTLHVVEAALQTLCT